ncbi:hypothetical protein CVV26_01595 [Candidatus Kuenenbacteria bacterium HGW-Kuenenbacteria-1]|uniref:Uncharacterized protein n=1 Tax=Candidatus Kuenenbacteria bacterium HGW-Kuenenbacteria-1 TaxID=2013812 RepID=A0A2N1UNS9_9BACT|nr:MAG: hypothetical protein CVV26_01595 [Candidatus Kuenenbacteria bacterium HGW-Kuenenbacteria-1]
MLKTKTKKTNKILFSLFFIVFCASLVIPIAINTQFANAATLTTNELLSNDVMGKSGLPMSTDLKGTIMRVVNVVLGFLGVIAVIIIIIGGFKYMTGGGSEEKSTEARQFIIAGIIGLAIVLSAYAIANFVIKESLTAMNQ